MTSYAFRNFRRAYGGDPDSAVLRDLHKRLMKIELLVSSLEEVINGWEVFRKSLLMPDPPED